MSGSFIFEHELNMYLSHNILRQILCKKNIIDLHWVHHEK